MQVPAIFLRSVSRLKGDRKIIKIVLKRTWVISTNQKEWKEVQGERESIIWSKGKI